MTKVRRNNKIKTRQITSKNIRAKLVNEIRSHTIIVIENMKHYSELNDDVDILVLVDYVKYHSIMSNFLNLPHPSTSK